VTCALSHQFQVALETDAAAAGSSQSVNLARFTLAKTLAELGKDAEAAEEYASCVEWQTAQVGAQHPSLRQQLLLLRGCLERSGQPEAAAEVQRRLEQLRRGGGAQRPPRVDRST
jgi:hypothetical protein